MIQNNTSTCKHCGYLKAECTCGKRRNTSGDPVTYQNYNDYRGMMDGNYSQTSRIQRSNPEERKLMTELNPVDGETLTNFIKRTDIAENEVIKYAIQHHLFGTRKGAWACHTTTRYCFICVTAQFLNICRTLFTQLPPEITDNFILEVFDDEENNTHINLINQTS